MELLNYSLVKYRSIWMRMHCYHCFNALAKFMNFQYSGIVRRDYIKVRLIFIGSLFFFRSFLPFLLISIFSISREYTTQLQIDISERDSAAASWRVDQHSVFFFCFSFFSSREMNPLDKWNWRKLKAKLIYNWFFSVAWACWKGLTQYARHAHILQTKM